MATATKNKKSSSKGKTNITPWMIACWSSSTKRKRRPPAAFSCPNSAKEKPMTGEVIAVGPGKLNDNGKRAALSVKNGDTSVTASTPAPKSKSTARRT